MLFSKVKVEPRHNPARPSQIRKCLKSKSSLPQTCSSGKGVFENIRLTQSHDIQNMHTSEFQLNVIPPNTENDQTDKLTKKFSCPEWLIASNMTGYVQVITQDKQAQNPQQNNENIQINYNDYSDSYKESEKTESHLENDLLKVDKSEIQRILEMTVSDDRERQLNETNFKSQLNCNDLESQSAFLYGHSSQDSGKANMASLELKNSSNQSSLSRKPKSSILISGKAIKQLDDYYKHECEMYSEYGLKPYEESRLRKIQEIQKIELLKDQEYDEQSELDQEYFSLAKGRKNGRQATKFRKCSAALLTQENGKNETQLSKKSKSKHKHSLSKDKKEGTPQAHGMSKLPSMKKSHTQLIKK